MAKTGWTVTTGGAVALSAGTAKTVLGVKAAADFGLDLLGFEIGFDGITASAVPVLVEVCAVTWATNSPGTNSTSVTPAHSYGRATAAGFTAAKTWTAEPTALTVGKEFLLTPNGGLVAYRWPLGNTPDSPLAEGFAIRCNAPAAVNVRVSLDIERA